MRNLFEHPLFIVILLALVAVLFGGKRLPEAARGLGRSMRIFKSEIKQMHEEDDAPDRPAAPVEGRIVEGPATAPRSSTSASEQRDTHA